nr:hypothetical protein [Tanacetum cinerariifolium]
WFQQKVLWLGVVEELLWLISGSTSAKLADVGSMWEGKNTSATCAMIRFGKHSSKQTMEMNTKAMDIRRLWPSLKFSK